MLQKTSWLIKSGTMILAGVFAISVARAQTAAAPSLAEQLKAQYKVTKTGRDSINPFVVLEPGTVLVVQKGGILGVPQETAIMAQATYKDGDLHPPGAAARIFLGKDTRYFQVGERVYVRKIDVNQKSDKITFAIFECDSCNGSTQPLSFKSEVVFEFPKGYLGTAETAQVRDVINQVLSIDAGTSNTQELQVSPAQQTQPVQVNQVAQAQPPTIQLGQTVGEVVAILGQPVTIVNLGSKVIYTYKDLKITFTDGRVSDVQ
jgi:hypothetical protein